MLKFLLDTLIKFIIIIKFPSCCLLSSPRGNFFKNVSVLVTMALIQFIYLPLVSQHKHNTWDLEEPSNKGPITSSLGWVDG